MANRIMELLTLQSSAAATGNGYVFNCQGWQNVVMQITGTFVGTITFEGTTDGTNYVSVLGMAMDTGYVAYSATGAGLFYIPVSGLYQVRARISAYTSGSITVKAMGGEGGGMTLNDVDISATEDFNLATIASQAPQLDDTDKIAVSLYGKASAAGDKELLLDSAGHVQADILTIAAGANHIGNVGGEDIIITQTPEVSAGAYSANDAVGGELTFANAARASGLGGIIKQVIFIDDAGQDAETELWLFDTTITDVTDNAAFAQTEAELHTVVGIISTSDGTWRASGTPSVCCVECSLSYTCVGTSLFGQLVTRGTPTYAATDDVTVRIVLQQN